VAAYIRSLLVYVFHCSAEDEFQRKLLCAYLVQKKSKDLIKKTCNLTDCITCSVHITQLMHDHPTVK
jgi:hypothetical protein